MTDELTKCHKQTIYSRKLHKFSTTHEGFPTNFVSAILSSNVYTYAISCFSFLSKAKPQKFSLHHDKIQ